ncbi:hypothetical protein BDN70DRAFT_285565 [Pholiota conissans]|uniref:Uncharacterized protein n=1 Tax=Pholiota conissans TaxID=109636 RepID=A0A9P5YW41_9AGAR|nr:hypothetical protein BDN70DRAFT_285565 [Pholiota conissans]
MTRRPYRNVIGSVLSWNSIFALQTTSKINLLPERSAPLAEMLDIAVPQNTVWTARQSVLFPRASPTAGSDGNDSSSADSSSLSLTSPAAPTPPQTTLMHSPPLPPFMGGSRSGAIELDDIPAASLHSAGRLRNSLPKAKRGSRYEDAELGQRHSDTGKIKEPRSRTPRGRSDTPNSRHSSNFASSEPSSGYIRRQSSGRTRSSRPHDAQPPASPISVDGSDFSAAPENHPHDQSHRSMGPQSLSSYPSPSVDPRIFATDGASFTLPPSVFSSTPLPLKGGEDLPPAYDDVK